MKHFAIALLSLVTVSLQAQDLKPVRDKATRLFGYQDKQKEWVISPAYDKAGKFHRGLAVVTVDGFQGLIDETGRTVLDFQYKSVEVSKRQPVCTFGVDTSGERVYGVCDLEGNILFEPQFTYAPSFDTKGIAYASDVVTGLKGVIDCEGNIVVPLENLDINSSFGGTYSTIDADFCLCSYNPATLECTRQPFLSRVVGYRTIPDPVQAAVWHKHMIAERLHQNNLKAASIEADVRGRVAICSDMPGIDWGPRGDRFVRFDLVDDSEGGFGSLRCATLGRDYVVRAALYESDGTFCRELCPRLVFAGVFNKGVVYTDEAGQDWMAFHDINTPYTRSFKTDLYGLRDVDQSSLEAAFNFSNSDCAVLTQTSRARDRHQDIIRKENAGISMKSMEEPELDATGPMREMGRWEIFHRHWQIGEVSNARLRDTPDGPEMTLSEKLSVHIQDSFRPFSLSFSTDQEVFWGPFGDRFVALVPVPERYSASGGPEKCPAEFDDLFGSRYAFSLALVLYESDGTFVQCLGYSPGITLFDGEYAVLDGLDIALRTSRRPRSYDLRHKFIPADVHPRTLSFLRDSGNSRRF